MKKFVILVAFIFFLFPSIVYAEKITTKIIGSDKVQPTETILYTIIIDKQLTEYSAEITYDRNVLNFVSIEEVNVNTTEKEFNYEKKDPIVINSKSVEPANIIYTITFNVKKYFKSDSTEISINTKLAKNSSDVYDTVETVKKINVVEEENILEEADDEKQSELSKTLISISKVLKQYDNQITIVSIGLNMVLLILLIISIRRKKVDYDF